ncbi:hypothetical protein HZH66_003211 [Vespula vulgaris]|uniref:Uncharacterized protein n=1 Tax=Vespula vulgaris TaxID=7454 RepID=A0A836UWY7_VESVU|nr:hypothetical protein HZH66_003211 [Vespula vulgaris]
MEGDEGSREESNLQEELGPLLDREFVPRRVLTGCYAEDLCKPSAVAVRRALSTIICERRRNDNHSVVVNERKCYKSTVRYTRGGSSFTYDPSSKEGEEEEEEDEEEEDEDEEEDEEEEETKEGEEAEDEDEDEDKDENKKGFVSTTMLLASCKMIENDSIACVKLLHRYAYAGT